jgi:ribose 5-phosphate isomerase A
VSVAATQSGDVAALKQAAAARAVEYIEDGMAVGLGTGTTAWYVVETLAALRAQGRLAHIVGVATSRATEAHARERGVPVATLDERPHLDLTIDGADEVDPALDLIKGHGGALLWEKIVASASDRLVIVVDQSKMVQRLGLSAALPVEVVPFGWRVVADAIRELGAEPRRRTIDQGAPFVTDGGHDILDCRFVGGIAEPAPLEARLRSIPGVVETGLFVGMAAAVVVGRPAGIDVLERRSAARQGPGRSRADRPRSGGAA